MTDPYLRRTIFAGRVLDVGVEEHCLPGGRTATFEVIRHPGGAAVLPVLADGRVVLIRQFRPALGVMLWEIPAGRLEPGETPEECVRRELAEEAGYVAGRVEALGGLWSAAGFCDEHVALFAAFDLVPVPAAPEPDEIIEPVAMPLAEALALVFSGELRDAKTQLALLHFAWPGGRP
ncbi:MAG: NUDIX hydrolase [Desulfuromonas sp.]|nr:NUDIX hydrolase [Desulfuromonas sp.]